MRIPRPLTFLMMVGAALIVSPSFSRAEPPPAPQAPKGITPPVPLTPIEASYPPGAQGQAAVVLAIDIDAAGSVTSAAVLEGRDPFAAAAVAAAKAWQFAPATRDGVPKASKIKVEVRFEPPLNNEPPAAPPPPKAPPAPPSGQPPNTPPPAPPSPVLPIEVDVRGDLPPSPGAVSMGRAEVRLLPGAFGDPFRAVEAMPGVAPLASGLPFYFVRGAPPGNVGYYLDDIRVPLLYHIGLGPSVIHPAIMDRVDLYPGGYPARFGRYSGGIVTGTTSSPPEVNGLRAEGNLRVVDAGALVEGTLLDGKLSMMAAGRYSYTGALLSLISSVISMNYWDYQARVTYRPTPRDTLQVFAFGAYDFLGQKDEDTKEVETLFDTTFHRIDLRYEHRFGPEDMVRQSVTFGFDQTHLDQDRVVRDRMVNARTRIETRVSPAVLFRGGVDVTVDVYDADLNRSGQDEGFYDFASLFSNRLSIVAGYWVDAELTLGSRLTLTPGLRVDFFSEHSQNRLAIDPRITAKLTLTPWLRLVQAHGLASQPPSFILPGPGFTRELKGPLQRSLQSSAGFEIDLPEATSATIMAFRHAFFELTDPLSAKYITDFQAPDKLDQRSVGSTVGLEIALRRRLTKRFGGLLSYTLSRSFRKAPIEGKQHPSAYDRSHVLNVAGSVDIWRGIRAGARVLLYTGYPQGNGTLLLTPAQPGSGLPPEYKPVINDPELARLKPFYRLDVRIEKRWDIRSRGWITLSAEVANATANKETIGLKCNSQFDCKPTIIGPVIIPSLGLEGGI